jgi:NarL family two-component system response regulator LiaR
MPKVNGIEVIKQIKTDHPEAKILVLTSFAADDQVFPAIKAGALGYLLKDTEPEDLIRSIREVYRGESSLSPTIARKVLNEVFHPAEKELSPDPLTKREIDVLQVLAKGKSNRDIAEELSISETTVRTHVSNILGKLHLASRTEAALYALKEGVANLEDIT